MLIEIESEQKFLLDIPEEVSSTMSRPPRGIYTRIEMKEGGGRQWLTSGKIIPNETWIDFLDDHWHKMLERTHTR